MNVNDLKNYLPQIGVGALVIGNLAVGWFLYQTMTTDYMEKLPKPTEAVGKIDLGSDFGDTVEVQVGLIPLELRMWDALAQRSPSRPQPVTPVQPIGGNGDLEEIIEVAMPVPADELELRGIISLNGEYLALAGVGDGRSYELREGRMIPLLEEVKVESIRPDGIIVSKPGHKNTFVPLSRPELGGSSWYQGGDDREIRGSVEITQ